MIIGFKVAPNPAYGESDLEAQEFMKSLFNFGAIFPQWIQ